MSKETAFALDRDTASTINPFIGVNAPDTLERSARVISDLGYVFSASNATGIELDIDYMFMVFETIGAAMCYEAHQLTTKKEVSHG